MMDKLIKILKNEDIQKASNDFKKQPHWHGLRCFSLFLCLLLVSFSGCTSYKVSPAFRQTKGKMVIPRQGHQAILLKDGRVLIWGGKTTEVENVDNFLTNKPVLRAEIYDPKTESYELTGIMHFLHNNSVAVLLQDGKVLISGGSYCFHDTCNLSGSTNEIYDPKTGQFYTTGSMVTPRYEHKVLLLPNGKVLIIAGKVYSACKSDKFTSCPGEDVYLNSLELYNPKTGLFNSYGKLKIDYIENATLLSNKHELFLIGIANQQRYFEKYDLIKRNSQVLKLLDETLYDVNTHYAKLNDDKFLTVRYINHENDHKNDIYRELGIFDPQQGKVYKKVLFKCDDIPVYDNYLTTPTNKVYGIQIYGFKVMSRLTPNSAFSYDVNKSRYENIGYLLNRPITNYASIALSNNQFLLSGGCPQSTNLTTCDKQNYSWIYDPLSLSKEF